MSAQREREPLLGENGEKNSDNTQHSCPITSRELDPEEAETSNLAQLEALNSQQQQHGVIHDSDQQMEHLHQLFTRPPSSTAISSTSSAPATTQRPSFKNMARRVVLMQKMQSHRSSRRILASPGKSPDNSSSGRKTFHRKNKSSAHELLGQIMDTSMESDATEDLKQDNAIFHSAGIELASSDSTDEEDTPFFNNSDEQVTIREEDEEDSEDEETGNVKSSEQDTSCNTATPESILPPTESPRYGSIPSITIMDTGGGTDKKSRRRITSRNPPVKKPAWQRLMIRCDPTYLLKRLCRVVYKSYFLRIGMPLFISAILLYYLDGNPEWLFIPGSAKSAWLLNFFGRQVVVLELARLTQWLVLDCIILASRRVALLVGPITTMTAVQARGWPFVVVSWACWDLLVLRGDSSFQAHWFYWTGIKLYSTAALSGQYILTSPGYFRFLLSMIVAGILTTAKRVLLTARFGRRMLADFKPTLEKLLADMVLVSEVAELAVEAGDLQDEVEPAKKTSSTKDAAALPKTMDPKGIWSTVQFEEHKGSDSEDEEGKEETQQDDLPTPEVPENTTPQSGDNKADGRPLLRRSSSGSVLFKHRLEKWDLPQNKLDKSGEATIQDVLKFKHALNFLDDEYPFGHSFGKASERNQAIDCSHAIYHKLLQCSPEDRALPFEVLSWITFDENDVQDLAKLKALRRLFRPDARGNLPLLAFIQSCDTVYKRFKYFKASVGNASVIDTQLEKIANCFFWFLLAMLILCIMQINPWPLLVSMTSLLVSVSFALGPSVSKYVEGILLIAVRRPFDLGDRILINSTESADSPGGPMGWFVEDIALTSTTLRFSKSNEVATVSNFSMSQSKIVNCQRSPNAIVIFKLKLHSKILEDNNLETLCDDLHKYVRDHPRIWDSMIFLRPDFIGGVSAEPGVAFSPNNLMDADYNYVILTGCFQHQISWQSAARVLMNRGDLIRHIYNVCKKMGVQYDDPGPRHVAVQNMPTSSVMPPENNPFDAGMNPSANTL